MPEDEILAHLLFGKSAGSLSAFELLQLAQATARLAGVNTGPGILDRIRENTGLDRLSLQQTEGAPGPSRKIMARASLDQLDSEALSLDLTRAQAR